MRELMPALLEWRRAHRRFVLAVVVGTSSSAPRDPGAGMAVAEDGEVVGSISGGCVEGDVVEVAHRVLATGRPARRKYGISDADAFEVGLTCGGEIDVFVFEIPADSTVIEHLADRIDVDTPVAAATIVGADDPALLGAMTVITGESRNNGPGALDVTRGHSSPAGTGRAGLDHAITRVGTGLLAAASPALVLMGRDGERLGTDVEVFVHPFAPKPRMIVFGPTDFTAALTSMGRFLGYRVTVCDARSTFATAERFPDADEVVVDWPHRYLAGTEVDARTALCVLTHDAKFEIPLLEVALGTDAGYIGAMGSRRTDRQRRQQLRDAGVPAAALDRLRSPIGLDLGAATPREVAVSIAAELVGSRSRASGAPLSTLDGPIHRQRSAVGT